MAADTRGRPIRFILTAGQSGDTLAAPALLEGFKPKAVLADKAYDSNALRSTTPTSVPTLSSRPTGREKL